MAKIFDMKKISDHIIVFGAKKSENLPEIATLVKWWDVVEASDLSNFFEWKRLIGTADTGMWSLIKKKYGLKRFKKVDILHTDMEVKNKGIELITLPKMKGFVGVVRGYQNIKLYEMIDFEKPARSMQVGMMPAKLTHSLVNIGLSYEDKDMRTKIWDPFCGTGTTGFIANYLGFDFIGSDLKIWLAEKNKEWRERVLSLQTPPLHPTSRVQHLPLSGETPKEFELFVQDISKPIESQLSKSLLWKDVMIVSEGRLWPVIKQQTTYEEILEYQRWVKNLYVDFLKNIADFFGKNKPVMVFTFPVYLGLKSEELTIEKNVREVAEREGWKMEVLSEVYKREGQKIGRGIAILSM